MSLISNKCKVLLLLLLIEIKMCLMPLGQFNRVAKVSNLMFMCVCVCADLGVKIGQSPRKLCVL
jgi:hypothetical protein